MKNVFKVLRSLRLAAAATHTAISTAISKKMFGSSIAALIIPNEEINMLFLICYYVH